MKSLSEIETTSKRASKAAGFSWGIAEEVAKSVRMLELFGLPGVKNLNEYYKSITNKKFEKLTIVSSAKVFADTINRIHKGESVSQLFGKVT